MPQFTKSVLRVGTYEAPEGTVVVTPELLENFARQHRALSKNKQVVPIGWDHARDEQHSVPVGVSRFQTELRTRMKFDKDGKPESQRSAANTVGRLRKIKLAEDGQSAELLLDIPNQKAAEKAKDNLVFVSPVIYPGWKDGSGNEYKNVITHVDLVNHPVDSSQGPFKEFDPKKSEPGCVACGLRLGLESVAGDSEPDSEKPDSEKPVVVYTFANGDDEDEERDKKESDTSEDETLFDGLDLDAELEEDADEPIEMADEETDADTADTDDIDDIGDIDFGDPELSDTPEADSEVSELLTELTADLESAGVVAPSTNPFDGKSELTTFLKEICAATKQLAKDKAEMEEPELDLDLSDDEGDDGLGDITFDEEDLEVDEPQMAQLSLKADAALRFAERSHRRQLAQELKSLVDNGQATPAEAKARLDQVKVVKLSLDENGNPERSRIEDWIEDRKSLAAGTVTAVKRLSLAEAEEPPEEMTGSMSAEEREKEMNTLAKQFPGLYRARA